MTNADTPQLGWYFKEGSWSRDISSKLYSLAGFNVLSKPQVDLYKLVVNHHQIHALYHGGTNQSNFDVYSKHTDLGDNCSGSSFPTLTCLSPRGPGTGSTGPMTCPPTSHTDVALSISSGSFNEGLGSGYSPVSLTVGGELVSVILNHLECWKSNSWNHSVCNS